MSTTIGCPIPGASQPKEPMRLIDANELLKYLNTNDCAYDGGEFQAYESCMMYVRDLVNDLPTIAPESLRPTAHWAKDRLPAKHECVLIYDSVCHNIYMAWRDDDLDVWFSKEHLPDCLCHPLDAAPRTPGSDPMTIILVIAAVCVYDLCGLLAVLYINHTDRMDTVDGADNVIVLIFWPLLVVTRIGIACYRIIRRLLK